MPSAAMAAAMAGAVDLSGLRDRPQTPAGEAGPGGAPAAVVQVTEPDFEPQVLVRSQQVPVIVLLTVPGHPQCVQLEQLLTDRAHADGGRWALAVVDVNTAPRIAQAFQAQAVPMVIAVAAGQPIDAFTGLISADELTQWLTAIEDAVAGKLSGAPADEEDAPERDPRLVAAEQMVDEGDLDGAVAAYEAILHSEPDHLEAGSAVRQIRFLARAQQVPATAVADADADPTDVAAQLDAADAELLDQRPGAAFTRLIGVVRGGDAEAKKTARARLLELLELFDPAEEFVITARRDLANALF